MDVLIHPQSVDAPIKDKLIVTLPATSNDAQSHYRADIDGLRAIAVLLVLLFHAGFGITGGYVGVDVFFVISGYLIAGIIIREQRNKTFRLSKFWGRRIRRILPPAFLMVAVTLGAGSFLLLPEDLEDLAKSTVAQQFMLSNVYFWRTTGYFAGPAELKPLLHTWSLAVEEQFYLGFPFLMLICSRFGNRLALLTLTVLALLSFSASEWGVRHSPSATFFLLPTRAWEMLLGAVVSYLPPPLRWRRIWLEIGACIGFAAIFVSATLFDSKTSFPGAAALVPCLGAIVLIHANSTRVTGLSKIISLPILVQIGRISYSLYLWHWPFLAYFHYWFGDELSLFLRVTAVILSFLFAYGSWRFVETPFRYGFSGAGTMRIVVTALISGLTLSCVAGWIAQMRGLPSRLPSYATVLLDDNKVPPNCDSNLSMLRSDKVPRLGVASETTSLDFVVWGDSHAMALANLFDSVAKEFHVSGAIAANHGTLPLLGVRRLKQPNEIAEWNDEVLRFIRAHDVKNVIFVAKWRFYLEEEFGLKATAAADASSSESAVSIFKKSLSKTVQELKQAGIKVWIVQQVPLQKVTNPKLELARSLFRGIPLSKGISIDAHIEGNRAANAAIRSVIEARGDLSLIDPAEYCFDEDGFATLFTAEGLYYQDNNHVSPLGAERLLRPMMELLFQEIIRPAGDAKAVDPFLPGNSD